MVKHFVISTTTKDNVVTALVKLDNATYQPFVVAWNYDGSDGTWGQGHYFCTLKDAVDYYYENYVEVSNNED